MRRYFNHIAFAVLDVLFVAAIVYAAKDEHGVVHRTAEQVSVDSADMDSVAMDSMDMEFAREDSIRQAYNDSVVRAHQAESDLMDTIVGMSQTIREKEDRDYSGYYWQWAKDCNRQIGIYLRKKGLYHGRLYLHDVEVAVDSVKHFVDEYTGYSMTQGDMNFDAGVNWDLSFLLTMQSYQQLLHARNDADYRCAIYRDYQHWYWTSEAVTQFYYQVIEGGDYGAGSIAPMEIAGISQDFCRLHRYWLDEELRVQKGMKRYKYIAYRDVSTNDLEREKKRYIRERIEYSDGDAARMMETNRITEASDSLIHVFGRWMTCRDSIESTIMDKSVRKMFHQSTRRIKWNMLMLWKNGMDSEKLIP
jgi:hypothetical protein